MQKLHIYVEVINELKYYLVIKECFMELKQLRINCKLTQAEASKIVGMPLRTYFLYEKDENKVKGYEKPKTRTAKQKKALMGFTQEY